MHRPRAARLGSSRTPSPEMRRSCHAYALARRREYSSRGTVRRLQRSRQSAAQASGAVRRVAHTQTAHSASRPGKEAHNSCERHLPVLSPPRGFLICETTISDSSTVVSKFATFIWESEIAVVDRISEVAVLESRTAASNSETAAGSAKGVSDICRIAF